MRIPYLGASTGGDLAWSIGGNKGFAGGKQVGDPEQLFPTHGLSGVRPAFCLPGTSLIEESGQVIEGETVYLITSSR